MFTLSLFMVILILIKKNKSNQFEANKCNAKNSFNSCIDSCSGNRTLNISECICLRGTFDDGINN